MATRKQVTPWMYQGKLFQNPNNKFGFVYLVTCNHPEYNKKYIGRKFFYTNFGKKTKQKESDWATYKTSSKYVAEAIAKYGLDYFTFEIVQLFDTRAGVVSAEVELQWAARVLHAVDEKGERIYINQAIGNIKFISKEQLSEEHKQKIGTTKIGNTYWLGKTHSEDTKTKIGLAHTGNTYWLGKNHNEETKNKIGEASKGNTYALGVKRTTETKAKMSKAQEGNTKSLGVKRSDETKAKISAALKGNKNGIKVKSNEKTN